MKASTGVPLPFIVAILSIVSFLHAADAKAVDIGFGGPNYLVRTVFNPDFTAMSYQFWDHVGEKVISIPLTRAEKRCEFSFVKIKAAAGALTKLGDANDAELASFKETMLQHTQIDVESGLKVKRFLALFQLFLNQNLPQDCIEAKAFETCLSQHPE
jgi:hypothetical protein